MNKKKINKLLASILPVVYASNFMPVFAEEPSAYTSNLETNNVNALQSEVTTDENSINNTIESKNENKNESQISQENGLKEESSNGLNVSTDNVVDNTVKTPTTSSTNDSESIESVDENQSTEYNENADADLLTNTLDSDSESVAENESATNSESELESEVKVLDASDEIVFKDENLLIAINNSLGRGETTDPIVVSDIESLTIVNFSSSNISDLSGIEYARNLTHLNLSNNNIDNLEPLTKLSQLKNIDLSGNNGNISVSDIKSLSVLPYIQSIIAPVNDPNEDFIINSDSEFSTLQNLDLEYSTIGNVEISNMPNLVSFALENSTAKNISIENLNRISGIQLNDSTFSNIYIDNVSATAINLASSTYDDVTLTNCNNLNIIIAYLIKAKDINLNNLPKTNIVAFPNSTINSVNINNVNCNGTLEFYNSNISSMSIKGNSSGNILNFNNANISSISIIDCFVNNNITMNNLISENVNINNVKTVETIYFNSARISNLAIQSMPNLVRMYVESLETEKLDLSEISSLVTLNASKLQANEVIISNISNLEEMLLTDVKSKSIVLEDLPSLTSVECSRLVENEFLSINNCKAIEYLYLDDSALSNFVFKDSFNNGYVIARKMTFNEFECLDCNITTLRLDGSIGKDIYIQNLTKNNLLCATNINIDNFTGLNLECDEIDLGNSNVKNIELKDFPAIQRLNLNYSNITNVNIDNLQSLEYLYMSNCTLDTISVLNAPNVSTVSTSNIKVKNAILDGFNKTTHLILSSAGLENLKLSGFEALDTLYINDNSLDNVDYLGLITTLRVILASNNNIENIDFIANLKNISAIDFSNNQISSIEELKNVTSLTSVKLNNNKISDISPLANSSNLKLDSINVLDQEIEPLIVYSKGGKIVVNYPKIIDIDGSIVPVTAVSNNGVIFDSYIEWEYYDDGNILENITSESINGNFSVNSNQRIIVDNVAPELELSYDENGFTNKDIIVRVLASDELSGVEKICLPDGSYVEENESTFTIDKNGEYTFVAKDKVGNTTEKTIKISNIDKVKPTVSIKKDKDLSDKEKVVVNITASDNISGIKKITLPDGTIISNDTTTLTFDKNGIYQILVEDAAGNITIESIEIKEIVNSQKDVAETDKSQEIPNTGGFANILNTASILSVIGGFTLFKRKK